MKKFTLVFIALALIITLSACASESRKGSGEESGGRDTTLNNSYTVSLTLEQMQYDPMSFTGEISVLGVVGEGDGGQFNFSLLEEDVSFVLNIDYRGNQALPEIGTAIIVTGEMNFRSCCGPHLISTHFEAVES